MFYNQILETDSLTTDPTRTEQDYAPLLTSDDEISELEFTVNDVKRLVGYLKKGSKMFIRVVGSKSQLVYYQCQMPTEMFLST